ncbi:MAG: phosphotransferase family protein [bacterium]|nr:phosphotransferase family protein [bacterium]
MEIIDKPSAVRNGEELDLKKVEDFLKDSIPGLEGSIEIKQFPSGFSNLTYLVTAGSREMILRRPPLGTKAKTAHDMSREYRILKALKPVYPSCPEPLVYTEDPAVMDCPFYVMERLKGIILRKDLPEGIELPPEKAELLSRNLIELLHSLHSIDYKAIGLGDFGKPEGYVKRQVEGWSKRYINAKTDDAPDYEKVMQWLHDNMPPDSAVPGVIHNDYKFDNVVLNPENPLEIVGVLDWEMATIGDPLMDLGNSLAYWVNKDDPGNVQLMRMMPTDVEGMLTREELVSLYSELSGRKVDSFDYYYCFGLFRLAVIAQQIYYRFFHGQTSDKRFGMLIHGVKILEGMAMSVIGQ